LLFAAFRSGSVSNFDPPDPERHDAAQKKAGEFKAARCLTKPVELDELLNAVKRFAPAHSKKDVA